MQLGFLDITLPNLGLNIWHPINIYQNKNIMTYMKSCYPTANLKKWDGRWESFGKNKLKFPQSGAIVEESHLPLRLRGCHKGNLFLLGKKEIKNWNSNRTCSSTIF